MRQAFVYQKLVLTIAPVLESSSMESMQPFPICNYIQNKFGDIDNKHINITGTRVVNWSNQVTRSP
jgi:hypothetical protein